MMPWQVSMSSHASNAFNPIRNVSDNTKPSLSSKPIIKLSVGDLTLDGNLVTPITHIQKIQEVAASCDWNGYTPSVGSSQARDAVATFWRKRFVHDEKLKSAVVGENIVLCSGGSHGILMAITALCDKGDYVLLPQPCFPHYETVCKVYGIGMHFYNCLPESNWEADLDQIQKLRDEKTKLLVMTNPSNPCGSNFSRQHVADILRVAEKLRLPVFSDEIYAGMIFKSTDSGATFTSVAEFDTTVPRIILGGTAKNLAVPGWRMGWLLYVDPYETGSTILEGLKRLAMLNCGPNTLAQGALMDVLLNTPQEYFDKNMRIIEESAMYLYKHLGECIGVVPTLPRGSMFLLAKVDVEQYSDINSDVEFFEKLLEEENVQVLPGSIFHAPGFIRLTATRPVVVCQEAVERIKAFCLRHAVAKE